MKEAIQTILFDPVFGKIISGVVLTVIIIALSKLIQKSTSKFIKESSSKYRVRKFINFFSFIIIILAVSLVYSDKLGGLTVAFGVAGAGIAFALQEIIVSIAGWIAITFGGYYKIGDRILLGGVKGDVIDIGVLRTTIMECGDWVDGDLYNGRVVRIANSFLFKDPVYNYSGDFPFLWDEVVIPIMHESNIKLIKETLQNIAVEIIGDYSQKALVSWNKMVDKYMIENAKVEPMLTIKFDENWISITIRYVVDYKNRRSAKDKLFASILEECNRSPEIIKLAVSSLEISQRVPFELNIKKDTKI